MASVTPTMSAVQDKAGTDPMSAIENLAAEDEPYISTEVFSFHESPGACSIAPQTTANLQLVWVGVQAIEQIHLKQTANFHWKQWRLNFDGSVSFGWVQTQP